MDTGAGEGPGAGGIPATGASSTPRTSLAVAAAVLSIIPLGVTQLAAIGLAILALLRIRASGGRLRGRGEAWVALGVSHVLLGLCCVPSIYAVYFARPSFRTSEGSAIGALQGLIEGQSRFQADRHVDEDGDGVGEFGWLGELSGIDPIRGSGKERQEAPYIAAVLGVKETNGVSQKSGYCFRMFLPLANGLAVGEARGPAALGAPDANVRERRWCCYAWPRHWGQSGSRAFFVTQEGIVYQTAGEGRRYDGLGKCPAPEAAFDASAAGAKNLDAPIADADAGRTASDGNRWVRVDR